jgi:hypothetical protein
MSYITREMAQHAVAKMKQFHGDAVDLYLKHDMDLLDNLGRRNIVMSQAQEKFFAQVLAGHYSDVNADGKTGQPDIIIGSLDKELECKLTSRHKGGAISFHTDFRTLEQKGSLDYLYLIADHNFEKFAVLHFIGLTVDDFRGVSNGSRGKVAMKKHAGMKKCNILMGKATNLNDGHLEKLEKKRSDSPTPDQYEKIIQKMAYWKNTPARYSFELEELGIGDPVQLILPGLEDTQVEEVSSVAP